MKFYIDCEFDGHNGPLLSIAMVTEDGRSLYIRTTTEARDPWVRANVVPLLDMLDADTCLCLPILEVGAVLRGFIEGFDPPEIIADSPVDIARFCASISTGPDGGWASTSFPRLTFEVHNVDCYPTDLPGALQHNAYWDAMALRHALKARDNRQRCGCAPEVYARVQRGGTCGMGGCPYGGDV